MTQKAISQTQYIDNPYSDMFLGFGDVQRANTSLYYGLPMLNVQPRSYQEEIAQCRWFYRYDPIASSVINRMCELSVDDIINRRGACTDEEFAYFNAIAKMLTPLLEAIAVEYFVAGMAVPDYVKDKIMGTRLDPKLGRRRYLYPKSIWIRNPENIVAKRMPISMKRALYIKVPPDEKYFIENQGKYRDGTEDRELFNRLVQQFPEYVQTVRDGKDTIALADVRPIMRKLMPTQDYPQPYLVAALSALKHKQRIKRMDYSIASKALDAIRLVKAGSDEFPLEEDDPMLQQLKDQINNRDNKLIDSIYTLFTNHTVSMEWIFPPLDALLSDMKYKEPNADIFFALGFSKVLIIGESDKSNAGQSSNSTIGPMAMLQELRRAILRWVTELYQELAEDNSFVNYPIPQFRPINSGDLAALATFAIQAMKGRAISKDLVARFLGSDYQSEKEQIDTEDGADPFLAPIDPTAVVETTPPQGT